jgi:hypothetical protein
MLHKIAATEDGHVRFEVFTAVTMENGVFWDFTLCGSCKNRSFVGSYRLLHQSDKNLWTRNMRQLIDITSFVSSSPILVTLIKKALSSSETSVITKPHVLTSQKTPFFEDRHVHHGVVKVILKKEFGIRSIIKLYQISSWETSWILKSGVFWAVTPCGSCKNRCFGGTWRRRYVPPKRHFLQEPHGITSQKTPFFIVTPWKPQVLHSWILSTSKQILLSWAQLTELILVSVGRKMENSKNFIVISTCHFQMPTDLI